MPNTPAADAFPGPLTIRLHKDVCTIFWEGQPVPLSTKWVVFYTLLAVHNDRHVSTDEICDHHPWSRLSPHIAGRDMWRFTNTQEERFFGRRITHSPARQASKLFTLGLDPTRQVRFEPSRPVIADHLRTLRAQRNAIGMELSECTLLLYSGLVEQAHARLLDLSARILDVNERAHTETLITMCLDEQRGVDGTVAQLPTLHALLEQPGLNRLNRARLLIRLARHATLSSDYDAARPHYDALRSLLVPEDGVEFCQYHINYGLYLRRTGKLEQAIHHQRVAHEAAQNAQWWYGVYAARSNLALMYLNVAEQSPPMSRRANLERALDWAQRASTTATLTRQPVSQAVAAVLIVRTSRLLGHMTQARHWLTVAQSYPDLPDRDSHLAVTYDELAAIEDDSGNHFLADVARAQAAQLRRT
ncbi:tetratricopeptide (TPR) repeat protein [Deinococcus metalli]|uniref:Tetratricopeptide (TPR) repeat protein n=1 Tax=Deinococcus metalli TaxID=1141878 RepID=A0A7W8KFS3_9DEIO|nr:hypothetical protein [Deinococcus metalli]MBB5376201.1 tetratricopeptide (TPR) repeat protein [Deinococcus metalli]GHF40032.1 hypothetical protein GCM10017781_15810 [Deinococcus metalli]